MEPLTKEQLEQAASIIKADLFLNGVIRAWTCGTHGQKALTYDVSSNGVQVRCTLCDSSNKWSLPEKQEKAKTCLVCGLPLTEKEKTGNPELICDLCYDVANVEDPQECKSQKENQKENVKVCLLCGSTINLTPINPKEPNDEKLCAKCWRLGGN